MSSLEKARRKLEKAGFTGQTLERAMELLERTNASGTGDQTGALAQGTVLKKNKMK